jgi:hypothetical protein
MLETLDAVFGTFGHSEAPYRILRLSAQQFGDNMRIRSGGRSAGKEGLVKRAVFEREGTAIAAAQI